MIQSQYNPLELELVQKIVKKVKNVGKDQGDGYRQIQLGDKILSVSEGVVVLKSNSPMPPKSKLQLRDLIGICELLKIEVDKKYYNAAGMTVLTGTNQFEAIKANVEADPVLKSKLKQTLESDKTEVKFGYNLQVQQVYSNVEHPKSFDEVDVDWNYHKYIGLCKEGCDPLDIESWDFIQGVVDAGAEGAKGPSCEEVAALAAKQTTNGKPDIWEAKFLRPADTLTVRVDLAKTPRIYEVLDPKTTMKVVKAEWLKRMIDNDKLVCISSQNNIIFDDIVKNKLTFAEVVTAMTNNPNLSAVNRNWSDQLDGAYLYVTETGDIRFCNCNRVDMGACNITFNLIERSWYCVDLVDLNKARQDMCQPC